MRIEELKKYRDDILAIARRCRAPNVRVFGSVARGESTEESDIDFLVDVGENQNLLDFIKLRQELEDLLGRKVDVAQSTVLHPMIRDEVLKDAIYLKDL